MEKKGWTNVTIVEGDACTFQPPEGQATLITFSYSLTMIPDFYGAVDAAASYLDPTNGILGVTDFYVSSKFDFPLRQRTWFRRFFWRCIFDLDGIDIGPERRQYLDHKLCRIWERNGQGPIPYVPKILQAPFYIWLGQSQSIAAHHVEAKVKITAVVVLSYYVLENMWRDPCLFKYNKRCQSINPTEFRNKFSQVEAPPLFPPTFLYTQSWEDPIIDEPYLDIRPTDVCLTLTSGGCNSLNLCLNGAAQVAY